MSYRNIMETHWSEAQKGVCSNSGQVFEGETNQLPDFVGRSGKHYPINQARGTICPACGGEVRVYRQDDQQKVAEKIGYLFW